MATFAFTDAVVSVDGNDLSDHVKQVKIHAEADELENTAMGATYKTRIAGLKDWSVDLEFNQDFAASEVDAILWPLLGTVVTVAVNAASGGNSATNPQYSGSVLIKEYSPLDGSVGDLATTSVSWPGAGTLSRATA